MSPSLISAFGSDVQVVSPEKRVETPPERTLKNCGWLLHVFHEKLPSFCCNFTGVIHVYHNMLVYTYI